MFSENKKEFPFFLPFGPVKLPAQSWKSGGPPPTSPLHPFGQFRPIYPKSTIVPLNTSQVHSSSLKFSGRSPFHPDSAQPASPFRPTRSAPARQPGSPKPIWARRHGHGVPGRETRTAPPPAFPGIRAKNDKSCDPLYVRARPANPSSPTPHRLASCVAPPAPGRVGKCRRRLIRCPVVRRAKPRPPRASRGRAEHSRPLPIAGDPPEHLSPRKIKSVSLLTAAGQIAAAPPLPRRRWGPLRDHLDLLFIFLTYPSTWQPRTSAPPPPSVVAPLFARRQRKGMTPTVLHPAPWCFLLSYILFLCLVSFPENSLNSLDSFIQIQSKLFFRSNHELYQFCEHYCMCLADLLY
jgi:hypothetical protein